MTCRISRRVKQLFPGPWRSCAVHTGAERIWLPASPCAPSWRPVLVTRHFHRDLGQAPMSFICRGAAREGGSLQMHHLEKGARVCGSMHPARLSGWSPSRSFSGNLEPSIADQNRFLRAIADMRKPHLWFPQARAMKRKCVHNCSPALRLCSVKCTFVCSLEPLPHRFNDAHPPHGAKGG